MDRVLAMEAFVRVVDAGSFAEAARRWGRSKAVVSKYVAQLETHLGSRLLRRTTRTLGPTDAGRAHYGRCQQILTLLDEAEAQLRADHRAPEGQLRVSAPPGFLSLYRRAVITTFLERYPRVRLDLDLTHRLVDVVEERIDVAVRLTRPDDSSLVARRIAPAPLILVASPGLLQDRGTPGSPEELAHWPCIMDTNFRFHPRWPVRVGDKRVRVEVSGPVAANNPLLVRDLACDGLGVALVPKMLATHALEDGSLVEILAGSVDAAWSVYAITSQRRMLPARARVFIEHLQHADL